MTTKKTAIFAIVVACTSVCVAQAKGDGSQPNDIKDRLHQWKRLSGGYVVKADPANGKVVVVNLQSKVATSELEGTVRYYRELTASMPFIVVDRRDPAATYSIEVLEDETSDRMLAVYPEERRAVVNVCALAKGDVDADMLAARTRKEVSRAISYLVGGGSQHPGTLAECISGPEELDKFKGEGMPPDVFMRISTNLRALNVRPVRRATYRDACLEGWAPAPTNDIQRAVWEQVKAEQSEKPTNPMRILPGQKPSGK